MDNNLIKDSEMQRPDFNRALRSYIKLTFPRLICRVTVPPKTMNGNYIIPGTTDKTVLIKILPKKLNRISILEHDKAMKMLIELDKKTPFDLQISD